MAQPKKRRRSSSPESGAAAKLQLGVLSVFGDSRGSFQSRSIENAKDFKTASFHHSTFLRVIEQLCCVSSEQGKRTLLQLTQEIDAGNVSISELSSHMYSEDDPDNFPPLCVIAHLLSHEYLRLADIDHVHILQRGVYELRNSEQCSCRGFGSGITSFLHCVLQEEQSTRRQAVLTLFVSVLFSESSNGFSFVNRKGFFSLAELTIHYLSKEVMRSAERSEVFVSWVIQSALPMRLMAEDNSEANKCWVAELSGLATGRNTADYLEHGAVEERALAALYNGISSAEASQAFIQCLNKFTGVNSKDHSIRSFSSGTWSRMVLLGRRALDISIRSDENKSERKTIEASILSACCSLHILSSDYGISVLLSLARTLFHCLAGEKADQNRQTTFKQWLLDLVNALDRNGMKTLIKVLMELVPLEPLEFLRMNYFVISRKRDYFDLSRDYLALVRTRISDLDPLDHGGTAKRRIDGGSDPNSSASELSNKALQEAICAVVDFTKANGSVPKSMIRHMNFHRHHFRTTTLRALLDANLASSSVGSCGKHRIDDKDAFDKQRIELIRTLAFTRKDHAVTKAEARKAMEAIQNVRTERCKTQVKGANGEDSKQDVVVVDETLSYGEIMKEIYAANQEKSTETNKDGTGSMVRDLMLKMLKKVQEALKESKEKVKVASLAQEVLQTLLRNLIHTLPLQLCFSRSPEDNDIGVILKGDYRKWWLSSGRTTLDIILTLLGDDELKVLQKAMQLQLLALVCTRIQLLSHQELAALAMITCAICSGSDNHELAEISFISCTIPSLRLRHISSILFASLPITNPTCVWASSLFAAHCILILDATGGSITYPVKLSVAARGAESTAASQRIESLESPGVCSLSHLLKWTLLSPWRLVASTSEFDEPHSDVALDDAGVLLKLVSILCKSNILPGGRLALESWLKVEKRSKWGRASSVCSVLRRFASFGISRSRIIGEALICLVSSTDASEGYPNWIIEGIQSYGDEVACCAEVSVHDDDDNLAKMVENCIDKHGATAGYQMVELLTSMDRTCYFHNTSANDIQTHIQNYLIPTQWPLSGRVIQYLMNSLSKNCTQPLQVDLSRSALLVSSVACKWDLLDCTSISFGSSLAKSVVQQGGATKHAISSLTSALGRSGVAYTQSLPPEDRDLTRAVERFSRAIGAGLVLHFVSYSYEHGEREVKRDVASTVCTLSAKVSEFAAVDVLDSAIYVAAFIPFAGNCAEDGKHDALLTMSQGMLEALIEERLSMGECNLPAWIGMPLDFSKKIEDKVDVLFEWVGGRRNGSVGSQDTRPSGKSVPLYVALSRLFIALLSASDRAWNEVVAQRNGQDVGLVLLQNTLEVLEALTFPDESSCALFSAACREKFLCFARVGRCQLVELFCVTANRMKGLEARHSDLVSVVLKKFPSLASEVRAAMRTTGIG